MTPTQQAERARRRLRIIRWVAVVDAVLLACLLTASFTGNRQLVSVLGPLHGGNFLLLLVLAGTGASDELWSWWFPAAVLLTAGPLGALIGELLIARRLPPTDQRAAVPDGSTNAGAEADGERRPQTWH